MAAVTRLASLTHAAVTDQVLEGYADHLEEYSAAILAKVFDGAEKESRFFPSVAELRELANALIPPTTALEMKRRLA